MLNNNNHEEKNERAMMKKSNREAENAMRLRECNECVTIT